MPKTVKQYRVAHFQATRHTVVDKNGMKAPATPIFAADQKQRAEELAEALNYAYEAGRLAQRLETNAPVLASLCNT